MTLPSPKYKLEDEKENTIIMIEGSVTPNNQAISSPTLLNNINENKIIPLLDDDKTEIVSKEKSKKTEKKNRRQKKSKSKTNIAKDTINTDISPKPENENLNQFEIPSNKSSQTTKNGKKSEKRSKKKNNKVVKKTEPPITSKIIIYTYKIYISFFLIVFIVINYVV